MTKRHKLSKRGLRRADERAAVDLMKNRLRLAELSPGGGPDNPLPVDTSALVEVTARSTRCAACEGQLVLDEHEAVEVDGKRLRRVKLTCRQCHTPRLLWFRLVSNAPS
jgi:hypothetical protein